MIEIIKEPFLRTALITGGISAILCAYLGVYVILKRIVFLGIGLSQLAALGVALGLFIGINPVLSAFVLTLLGTIFFWIPYQEKNISRESLIGLVYAFSASASLILIAKNPLAEARGLDIFSGNILYSTKTDVISLIVISSLIGLLHLVLKRKFIFVSFDKETAFTTGVKANFFELLLFITIGIAISSVMKICGIIYVFSSLIIPPLTALLLSKNINKIFFISMLIAFISVILGLIISYDYDLPTSPLIVIIYTLFFFVFLLLRIRR